MDKKADKAIRKHFNSRARKIKRHHNAYLVPLKYDAKGAVLTEEKFDARKHYKKLTQDDWAFLEAWQRNGYDQIKTQDELNLTAFNLTRLVRKLECFKAEEFQDKALAQIPTAEYIQARHVENVMDGSLDDSQRDSLKELAKIKGVYKNSLQVNIQNNTIQLSVLSPDEQKRLKEIGDSWTEAQVVGA